MWGSTMRVSRHGDVVMVTSTAGRLARPGLGAYTAATHALEGMVDALSQELAGTGVHVVAVEPGTFATEWGTTLTESSHLDTYRDITAPMLAGTRAMKQLPTAQPPALFAAEVLRLIASDERPTRLPIGADAWQALLDAAQREHTALLNARPVPV